MQYLLLPIHLIKFWYLESLITWIRTWKNLITYLEEDLAVGLMLKLLFVPLFHDSSFIGRVLSFIFRSVRIIIGLFAFGSASAFIIGGILYWLVAPILVFISPSIFHQAFLFMGVGLFLIHRFSHPHRKVWQIKNGDLWLASSIKKSQVSFTKLLKDEKVGLFLSYLQLQPEDFSNFAAADIDKISPLAFEVAKKLGSEYLDSRHFFLASLEANPNLESFLLQRGLEKDDLELAMKYLHLKQKKWRRVWIWEEDFSITHLRGTNRGWLGAPTPTLDSISRDLTKEAAQGNLTSFFGRQATLTEVVNILSLERLRNVILVGPAGSGKTTLIESLAKSIVSGNAPPALATKRIVEIDLTRLISGIQGQGDIAAKVKTAFEEAEFAGDIILVLEEIHTITQGQAGSEFNLYTLLSPFLEFGNLQFIATTEAESYLAVLEKNSAVARLFTKVEISPATEGETLEILMQKALEMERKRKVRVSISALKKLVSLAATYIHDRVLPDSAISILDESVTRVHEGWINTQSIEEVFSTRVNVPIGELGSAEKSELLDLETTIHERLIDQQEAVKKVADALRRGATKVKEGSRPIASFLFVGPTGVGKTELAKILSEVYFKGGGAYLRFDMSEYQNEASNERLIKGLTQSIKNKPYSLILLDEFEKADPKILTLFLQVLEDGRLTNTDGQTSDFFNAIIIATSNAASLTIAKGLENGQDLASLSKQVNSELLQIFKPELVNRFDEVVLFKSLSEEDLQKVVVIKLQDLKMNLRKKGYLVDFDNDLITTLAQKGYDPVLGARPLRRLMQDSLESQFSKLILEGKLVKGFSFKAGVELIS